MSYTELLRDPRWQKKRLEIMSRDNFKCCNCGTDKVNLQVHHLDYYDYKRPWDYPENLLITLCEKCHQEEQVRFRHENLLLVALRDKGFLAGDILALSTQINSNDKLVNLIKRICKSLQNG